MQQGLVARLERRIEVAQDIQRRFAIQAHQNISIAARDAQRLADWATSLRHQRIQGDIAGHCQADGPGTVTYGIEKERIFSGLGGAAGQATDFDRFRIRVIQSHQEILDANGKRIG